MCVWQFCNAAEKQFIQCLHPLISGNFVVSLHWAFITGKKVSKHLASMLFAVVIALGLALSLVELALAVTPAFATVPAPVVGAGLPVLAILGGGYWLIRKLRERR